MIDRILERALAGERLGLEDGLALFESDEIEKIGHYANLVMQKFHPEPIVTFVISRNINYSNICDRYCRFCAFYRPPGSPEEISTIPIFVTGIAGFAPFTGRPAPRKDTFSPKRSFSKKFRRPWT